MAKTGLGDGVKTLLHKIGSVMQKPHKRNGTMIKKMIGEVVLKTFRRSGGRVSWGKVATLFVAWRSGTGYNPVVR